MLVTVEYLIDPRTIQPICPGHAGLKCHPAPGRRHPVGFVSGYRPTPGRFLETFIVETWMEHRRQHERMTVADRAIEEQAFSFHIGGDRPRVQHLIYAYGRRGRDPEEEVYHENLKSNRC